jgi:hypothetical protein
VRPELVACASPSQSIHAVRGRAVAVAITHPPSFIDILRNPDALTAVVASINAETRMLATEDPVISAVFAAAMVDPDAAVVAAEMDALGSAG